MRGMFVLYKGRAQLAEAAALECGPWRERAKKAESRVAELENLVELMRREMADVVRAYHGRAVLFEPQFLSLAARKALEDKP